MKELHTYAPADLIRFMEFVHGAPVELEAYKDENRYPPCRMIRASFAGGQIVFRVRSQKHKFTVDVSGPVLAANPDLFAFLKEEQKGRWFVDALGLYPALGWLRRFTVSPRRAEALKTLLSGAVVPRAGDCDNATSQAPAGAVEKLEKLTGRILMPFTVGDWWCSSSVGPATCISLGQHLPEIIYHAGEVFAGTHSAQIDCPLADWIISSGTTFAAVDGELVAKHPFFIKGGQWYSFRHIPASDFKEVCRMISELTEYQITHEAPGTVQ